MIVDTTLLADLAFVAIVPAVPLILVLKEWDCRLAQAQRAVRMKAAQEKVERAVAGEEHCHVCGCRRQPAAKHREP